jgi:hypothetical protein
MLDQFLWANLEKFWSYGLPELLADLDVLVTKLEGRQAGADLGWRARFTQEIIKIKQRRKDASSKKPQGERVRT